MTKFKVDNVSKTYDSATSVVTLQDINFEVESGEFICIIGPSGCGKSTLLELLGGLQQTTNGKVFIDNEKVIGPNKKLGFVFQDPSLYPWRTISRNISIGLEFSKVNKKEIPTKVESYLKMMGLEDFADQYPNQLSGGMRQRVGIARALINSPQVLLMDEPFGAVDHLTRLNLQNDLLNIWEQEKKTVIFVTHDVGEAIFLADRIVLLTPRPGKIQKIFSISIPRPRRRDDVLLLDIQNEIYKSIHQVKTNDDLEYII